MAAAVLAAALLAGCGKPEPLRIGFLGELTGRSADLGEAARNGLTLALEEMRAKGAFGDRPVEVLIRDTGDNAKSAADAAAELAAARVEAIVGPISSAMVDAILPVTEKAGIVVMTPTATALKFHGRDDHLFRINWTTRDNGGFYARRCLERGLRRVSATPNADNGSYTQSWLDEFRAAFEKGGGQVVMVRPFESATADHGPLVDALLEPAPDALVIVATAADTARIAQQAHKRRPGLPLVAADWAGTDQLIELGGRAVEGLFLVQAYDRQDASPRFGTFRETYAKRFGRDPVYASVLGFDASIAVLQGLARRQGNASLKEALIRLGPFDGLQQSIRFDANGDTERKPYYVVVREGRFVTDR